MKTFLILLGYLCLTQSVHAQKRKKPNYTPLMGIEHKRSPRTIIKAPLQNGDFTIGSGFNFFNHSTNEYFLSAEYSLSRNVGLKGTIVANHLLFQRAGDNYSSYTADMTYHFIQTRRWDVHAFMGLTYQSHLALPTKYHLGSRKLNDWLGSIGLGIRLKIANDYGLQFDIGNRAQVGLYKTFKAVK